MSYFVEDGVWLAALPAYLIPRVRDTDLIEARVVREGQEAAYQANQGDSVGEETAAGQSVGRSGREPGHSEAIQAEGVGKRDDIVGPVSHLPAGLGV